MWGSPSSARYCDLAGVTGHSDPASSGAKNQGCRAFFLLKAQKQGTAMSLAGIRTQTEHRPGHLVLWSFQFSLEGDCAVQYWRTHGPKFLAGYPGSHSQQRHGVHKWVQGAGMEAADVFLTLDSIQPLGSLQCMVRALLYSERRSRAP